MFSTFKIVNKVESTIKINAFLYSISKLPLIGKRVEGMGYGRYKTKKYFMALMVLFEIVKQIAIVALGFLIGVYVFLTKAAELRSGISITDAFYNLYFIIYFGMAGLFNNLLFERSDNRYICVKRFHMNAREYFITQFTMKHFWNLVGEIPVFLYVGHKFGIKVWLLMLLLAAKEVFAGFGEMMHLLLYDKKKINIISNFFLTVGIKAVFIILAYCSVLFLPLIHFKTWVIVAVAMAVSLLGVIGLCYLLRYKNYYRICNEVDQLDELTMDLNAIQKERELGNLQYNEEEHSSDNPVKYINDIFFIRHKKIIYSQIKGEIAFAFILLAGVLVAGIVQPSVKEFVKENLNGYYLYMVFILYGMSNARKVTKALFFNCDMSLLRYHFYRRNLMLLGTFLERLVKLIRANVLVALSYSGVVVIVSVLWGMSLKTSIYIALFYMVTAAFFALHELFLYYVLQPYNAEQYTSKFSYTFIQMITSLVCFSVIAVKIAPATAFVVMAAITVIYLTVACYIVYKYSERTMRVW